MVTHVGRNLDDGREIVAGDFTAISEKLNIATLLHLSASSGGYSVSMIELEESYDFLGERDF